MTETTLLQHVGAEAAKSAPPVVATTYALLTKGLPFIISVMTLLYVGIQIGYLVWRWHADSEDRRARREAKRAGS